MSGSYDAGSSSLDPCRAELHMGAGGEGHRETQAERDSVLEGFPDFGERKAFSD